MATNNQEKKEQKESQEPAHHARRPMNAFLIFCKRHRASVRLHFPHLENRAVTRVLGEWWATLYQDQKQSYIDLAQEYKDAFLNANPDFKWYKLPAPPLRTLTTRPTNKKQDTSSNYDDSELSNANYESSDCHHQDNTTNKNEEAIQPGKLADETQIGGLSSLFTPSKNDEQDIIPVNITTAPSSEQKFPKPPKKRYTELSIDFEQKRDCKVDLFGEDNNAESNNNLNEEEDKHDTNYSDHNASLDDSHYLGERSCKGVRYQKFLAEQLKTSSGGGGGPGGQQTKRKKPTTAPSSINDNKCSKERRNSISSNVSEKTDSLSSEGGNSNRSDLEHLVDSAEGRVEASKPENTETEEAESQQNYEWTTRKRFKAEDFNLEKKIEALPSLSLEEFQEKKKQQRTKKKKIPQKMTINTSIKRVNQNNGIQSTSENKAKLINTTVDNIIDETEKIIPVGSQKRKARKQSITRNTNAEATSSKQSQDKINQPWCASPDLEALACLAEIAANRTKLTK
ncbi:HMG box transcription factor BBX isoform X2 [Aphidius gifuensis]|uniref:HMG box transcription factor BBX isoform X2 n=1 Tax=Aphidius gifuensis TaxID=684658 RepID=UPI001CDB9E59|nr:HMG box transcription factor BBX isoform X2 [Aphidius gifuensis]